MNDDPKSARTSRRALLAAGVNVSHYDLAAVVRGLEALDARIVTSAPQRLHFRCPDGLGVELVPVDPARIWGLA
jgi:hypothetical protein